MKENIPFDGFVDLVKFFNKNLFFKSELATSESDKISCEMFSKMKNITWDDFLSCTKDEMEKIPIGWLYDWTHITVNYDKQDKVEELYSRYNLVPLDGYQYLQKYNREFIFQAVIEDVIDEFTFRRLIKKYLACDGEFIADVDKYLKMPKLKDKNIVEREEILLMYLCNASRSYLLKVLALKHIFRLATSKEQQEHLLDLYWKDQLSKLLKGE